MVQQHLLKKGDTDVKPKDTCDTSFSKGKFVRFSCFLLFFMLVLLVLVFDKIRLGKLFCISPFCMCICLCPFVDA